jgi:uncharacterized protein YndB with AHSA1/START domain
MRALARTASVVLSVDVAAPPDAVFAAATDWPGHSKWMLGTTAEPTRGDGASAGSSLRAVTGIGGFGAVDTMDITEWVPGARCGVVHTGALVRGTAMFAVVPRPDGTSVFVWSEQLDLPFGILGALGWRVAAPAFELGLRYSLRRFAAWAPTRSGAS